MKKLDLGTITMGLDTLKDAFEQNTGIGWSELVDARTPSTLPRKTLTLPMIPMRPFGTWQTKLRWPAF